MRRARIIVLALAASATVVSRAVPVAAQPTASANERFAQAQALFDGGQHAAALPIFEQLANESGSPNAWLYVGRCLRELGRAAEAHEAMSTTLRLATGRAEREDKYLDTRNAAAVELAILDAKVGKVIVALAAGFADARVTVGERTLTPAQIGVPVAVEPGAITVVAISADGKSLSRTVQIRAGETSTVSLATASAPAAASTPGRPAPAATEDARPAPRTGLRTVGLAVAGVGVGGLIVAGVASAAAGSKYDEVSSACGGKRCTDPKYADTIDSGKSLDTLATVGLFAGLGLVAAGGALVVVGWPSPSSSTTGSSARTVRVALSPTTVQLTGHF